MSSACGMFLLIPMFHALYLLRNKLKDMHVVVCLCVMSFGISFFVMVMSFLPGSYESNFCRNNCNRITYIDGFNFCNFQDFFITYCGLGSFK